MNNANTTELPQGKPSSAIQITNQIPKTQSLQIQNIDSSRPIQLRIDPVTDYLALSVTVIVSVVVAAISAYITIRIVTKSNEKLIESQKVLHERTLQHERDKELMILTSKNRQDWINTLRTDIAEAISQSSNITHNLRAALQISYIQGGHEKNTKDFSVFITSYQIVDSLISKIKLFLNNEKTEQNKLINELDELRENLMKFCNYNLSEDQEFYTKPEVKVVKKALEKNINNISKQTVDIIKNEWRKAKTGS
ncbi:hypothetical protein [Acinetobacter indicus]|uniref:hypothetical protein n=1 Tax=Acinetobacter indicus TaxID=756892 RepID=UPI000CEB45CF|nr:hypothetical protein [Acinetobacter indicus]AVH14354.1 hypothetical protein CTZ23_08675 [Acinetobacter indicus]